MSFGVAILLLLIGYVLLGALLTTLLWQKVVADAIDMATQQNGAPLSPGLRAAYHVFSWVAWPWVVFGKRRGDSPTVAAPGKVRFKRLTVRHGVVEQGLPGLVVEADVWVHGLGRRMGRLVAWFLGPDGNNIPDQNGYFELDGLVAAQCTISAHCDPAEFSGVRLFMPYVELHVDPRCPHRLSFRVDVVAGDLAAGERPVLLGTSPVNLVNVPAGI